MDSEFPPPEEADNRSEHSGSTEFNLLVEVVAPRASEELTKVADSIATTKEVLPDTPAASTSTPERQNEEPARDHGSTRSEVASGIPGAFALGNDQRMQHTVEAEADSTSFGDDDNALGSSATVEVPVANPVDDPDVENLPRAQLDESRDTNLRDTSTKKRNIAYIACFGSFILVLILILALALSGNSGNTTDVNSTTSTHSPTQSPTSELSFLYSALQLSSETIRLIEQVPGSDQAVALDWMVEDLTRSPQLLDDPRRSRQRFGLAALYFATNGKEWHQNENWLSHDLHECDWYNRPDFALASIFSAFIPGHLKGFFPTTSGNVSILPPPCNIDGLYENLWLDQNNLIGTIPDELYPMLPHLRTLSLGLNGLQGPISTKIGQLRQLEGVFVYGQQAAGAIPSEIGLLTNMRFLCLVQNDHTGQIPSELWGLSKLDTLSLNFNPQLRGTLPSSSFGDLTDLRFLLMDGVSLSGK